MVGLGLDIMDGSSTIKPLHTNFFEDKHKLHESCVNVAFKVCYPLTAHHTKVEVGVSLALPLALAPCEPE